MTAGAVTIFDERMRDLVLPNAAMVKLDGSALWAEGPVYFPAGDYLLWSDIPNERVLQWVPDLGVRVYSHRSGNCNGNTRDQQGRRVTCEHLTRSVVRFEPDGTRTVLADRHAGKRLNSPNDVVVAADGAVWFTDPSYGILSHYEGERAEPEQEGCFVYRIDPVTGAVAAAIDTMRMPNGLAFSPDHTVLYVADSSRSHYADGHAHVKAFDIGPGGTVRGERVLATIDHGVPDGLRVDEFGNVWISSERGVEVFSAAGVHLGVIHVPEPVANLTFGGAKNNRLFITATTSVYAVFTAVRGAASV